MALMALILLTNPFSMYPIALKHLGVGDNVSSCLIASFEQLQPHTQLETSSVFSLKS